LWLYLEESEFNSKLIGLYLVGIKLSYNVIIWAAKELKNENTNIHYVGECIAMNTLHSVSNEILMLPYKANIIIPILQMRTI
jgi:hypothetical protein